MNTRNNIIASILLIVSALLLLSEYNETCTLTYYILFILFIKAIGVLTGYIAINLIKFPN